MPAQEPHEPGRGSNRDPGWVMRVGSSFPLLNALYLRDSAGLHGAGTPALPPLDARIPASLQEHLLAHDGGVDALRVEWEAWWSHLLRRPTLDAAPQAGLLSPLLEGSPALKRVAQAHHGVATVWAQEALARARESLSQVNGELQSILKPRRPWTHSTRQEIPAVTVLVLPLSESRAWLVEPATIIVAQRLLQDPAGLRAYLEPMMRVIEAGE